MLKKRCLLSNVCRLLVSVKNGRLKIGEAFAVAMIASCLSLAVIAPHRAIETASAKTAAEERSERIEAALFTRAEFFGAQAIIP